MYNIINLKTGTIKGVFSSYESADNLKLSLDDFYLWDVEYIDNYVEY